MPLPDGLRSCTVGVPGHCLVSRIASIAIPLALAIAACSSGLSSPTASVPPSLASSAAPSVVATSSVAAIPAASVSPASSSVAPGSPEARTSSPTPGGSPGDANASMPPIGSAGPSVVIDESLAAMLPATVDGLPVSRATETETAAQGSPDLGTQASGFAAAQVISGDGSELAIVSMIRLRESTDAAGFFASYRPSYDQAACAPAGGVSSTEERTISGRSVQTTLCAEGATVYHVLLDDGRIIVSVLEAGTMGYGRSIVEGLKG